MTAAMLWGERSRSGSATGKNGANRSYDAVADVGRCRMLVERDQPLAVHEDGVRVRTTDIHSDSKHARDPRGSAAVVSKHLAARVKRQSAKKLGAA